MKKLSETQAQEYIGFLALKIDEASREIKKIEHQKERYLALLDFVHNYVLDNPPLKVVQGGQKGG